MHAHKAMHSFNQSSSYIKIQGVTAIKAANKGLLNDYSQKMIYSISRLQEKSSEVVEANSQRNSRGLFLSNTTAKYDSSSISRSFSQSTESNQAPPQKGSIFFTGDNNTQKMMTSN